MALWSFALNAQNIAIAVAAAGLIGLVTGASSVWYVRGLQIDSIKATYAVQVADLNAKANKANFDATALKTQFESNLEGKRNELDQTYAARIAAINLTVGKLAGIRLRLPPATGADSGTACGKGSAQGSNGSCADGSRLLPEKTSSDLWNLAGESQLYLERLNVCKSWAAELTTQQMNYNTEIEKLRKAQGDGK